MDQFLRHLLWWHSAWRVARVHVGPSEKGDAEVQRGVLVAVTACRWSALRGSPAVPGLMVSGPKWPMAGFPEGALGGGQFVWCGHAWSLHGLPPPTSFCTTSCPALPKQGFFLWGLPVVTRHEHTPWSTTAQGVVCSPGVVGVA